MTTNYSERLFSDSLKDAEKKLKEALGVKKQELEEWESVNSSLVSKIPDELREAAAMLLVQPKDEAAAMIERQNDEIEEDELRLIAFHQSSERNILEYFFSWKWLRKIPK